MSQVLLPNGMSMPLQLPPGTQLTQQPPSPVPYGGPAQHGQLGLMCGLPQPYGMAAGQQQTAGSGPPLAGPVTVSVLPAPPTHGGAHTASTRLQRLADSMVATTDPLAGPSYSQRLSLMQHPPPWQFAAPSSSASNMQPQPQPPHLHSPEPSGHRLDRAPSHHHSVSQPGGPVPARPIAPAATAAAAAAAAAAVGAAGSAYASTSHAQPLTTPWGASSPNAAAAGALASGTHGHLLMTPLVVPLHRPVALAAARGSTAALANSSDMHAIEWNAQLANMNMLLTSRGSFGGHILTMNASQQGSRGGALGAQVAVNGEPYCHGR